VRNGGCLPKTAFALDWNAGTMRCPNAVTLPFTVGSVIPFAAGICAVWPLRARCTSSAQGRRISTHPNAHLLRAWRGRQQSPEGRAKLGEGVAVAPVLAPMGRWQGRGARNRGLRRNVFDLPRSAVVHNLQVIARQSAVPQAPPT
jgi:transposase